MCLYAVCRCKKRLKPEPRPVAGIELHRRENAQENQYVENPHYDVPLRPRQANPNNTSAASEGGEGGEAGGGGVEALREQCDEAGQGGEAHEGGESGEVRGEEHLNPHYYNRLKHSFNQQMEGERPITKVISTYGNNIY